MSKRRSFKVGLNFSPFKSGKRAQRAFPVSEALHLSRFRQLTHLPSLRGLRRFLKVKARVSSRSGALSSTPLKRLKRLNSLAPESVERLRQSMPLLDITKICKERKARREVIFAKKKQGGNHKPPKYTLKSLVRCS